MNFVSERETDCKEVTTIMSMIRYVMKKIDYTAMYQPVMRAAEVLPLIQYSEAFLSSIKNPNSVGTAS